MSVLKHLDAASGARSEQCPHCDIAATTEHHYCPRHHKYEPVGPFGGVCTRLQQMKVQGERGKRCTFWGTKISLMMGCNLSRYSDEMAPLITRCRIFCFRYSSVNSTVAPDSTGPSGSFTSGRRGASKRNGDASPFFLLNFHNT